MTEQDLRNSLKQLRAELSALVALDPSKEEKVRKLMREIDLMSLESGGAKPEGLQELLTDSVTAFEASHPKLTGLMNQIASLLSSIGI